MTTVQCQQFRDFPPPRQSGDMQAVAVTVAVFYKIFYGRKMVKVECRRVEERIYCLPAKDIWGALKM